jgi:hypothetical protein
LIDFDSAGVFLTVPPNILTKVDFPDPLAPSNEQFSPFSMQMKHDQRSHRTKFLFNI